MTMHVLVIDVGGTHVKMLATGHTRHRQFDSGPTLSPADMVAKVRALASGWTFDRVSIGYPGPVLHDHPVAETVAELTGGRGADAVIDTVGGELFGAHLAALGPDGRLATCGAHAGEVVELDIIELFRRGHRILGFRVASPDEIKRSLRMALDGRIRVPVARTFALRDAAAAHEFLDRREHVGKVVLTLP